MPARTDLSFPLSNQFSSGRQWLRLFGNAIHVLILVPVFFIMMKERALHRSWRQEEELNGPLNYLAAQGECSAWQNRSLHQWRRWPMGCICASKYAAWSTPVVEF
jgi:hypothetical protein